MKCALCEKDIDANARSILCEPCQDDNRDRVRRMGTFGEVYSAMRLALKRIAEFQSVYPDAAQIVEAARIALADTFGPIMNLHTEMQVKDREISAKMDAAHMARRV
jgi:hypothetical protein